MLIYKIIGAAMLLTGIVYCFASWLREYMRGREKRRRKRLLRKHCRAYRERFRKGTLRDIENWRNEDKPPKKRLNVVCKDPRYAEVWR